MNNNKESYSLSHRVIKGGVWVFALRILEKALGLIRLVIFGDMKIMVTDEKYNTKYYDTKDLQREEIIKHGGEKK